MNDLAELKDRWGQPAPPSPTAQGAARAALLGQIHAARAPEPALRRRVWLGWLAGSAAVAATTVAVAAISLGPPRPTQPGQPAGQAPGEISGPQVLLNAAVVAQARPANTGAYWHVKEEIPVPGAPKPIQTYNTWIARDGMHYIMPDGYPGVMRIDLDAGFSAGDSLLTLQQIERLPADPDTLKAWMTDAYLHPSRSQVPPSQVPAHGTTVRREVSADQLSELVAEGLTRLLWQVPAPPVVRSAALRALAGMPNVTNLGPIDGGQALRITFPPPRADKFPNGKLPPGAGQLTLIIDPQTSTLLSSTNYVGTTKVLEAAWTNDMPKILPSWSK